MNFSSPDSNQVMDAIPVKFIATFECTFREPAAAEGIRECLCSLIVQEAFYWRKVTRGELKLSKHISETVSFFL